MSNPASESYHEPVLAESVVELLITDREGCYLDLTVGGGGHLKALAAAMGPGARLYGVDRDPEAATEAAEVLAKVPAVRRVMCAAFSDIESIATELRIDGCRGILMDLGISSHQIDDPARGFSFRHDGPLDMRMDPQLPRTAADLVNSLGEQELRGILRDFGEERQAARLARAIVRERQTEMIRTTKHLADLVAQVIRGRYQTKSLARVFQAFRIAVNQELDELRSALPAALSLLSPGGRIVVISYHSLEDRVVKNLFRDLSRPDRDPVTGQDLVKDLQLKLLTRKPVVPSDDETERNPRARSAKLRAAERM